MTINEAIVTARTACTWGITPYEPTSVDVGFIDRTGREDETQFDLYSGSPEQELERLWESMHDEFGADHDSVTYVEAYGYIVE